MNKWTCLPTRQCQELFEASSTTELAATNITGDLHDYVFVRHSASGHAYLWYISIFFLKVSHVL